MGSSRHKIKYRQVLNHRTAIYEQALDNLMQGRETVEYVRYRFKKLKALKK